MAKPQSKKELIALSQKNYAALMDLVNSYSSEELVEEFPSGTLNRNIRDVLAHLHHWHLLLLGWYEVGMKGEIPFMPDEGHTWRNLLELNKKIWQEYQQTDLKTTQDLLNESYENVQSLMTTHTDKELFEKKRYRWTGSTSLGAYFISNTSSHYDWAIKLIKKSKE